MGVATGGSGWRQAPQVPASARCVAGTRLDRPQDGQARIIEDLSIIETHPFDASDELASTSTVG
jgi:hypothetical protein